MNVKENPAPNSAIPVGYQRKHRRKRRAKRGLRRSLIAVLSFCLAILAICIVTVKIFPERATPFSFYAGSSYYYQGDKQTDMGANALLRQDCIMAPAAAVGAAFHMKVTWLSEQQAVQMKIKDRELVFTIGADQMSINGEMAAAGVPAFLSGGRAYVPVDAVASALNYGVNYTEKDMRLDVYNANEKENAPKARFSLDKDSYQQGEKVAYTMECSDPDGDEIVDYEWTNHKDRFFDNGEQTISLKVKDSHGQWSEPYSVNAPVEGAEYRGAEKVPVLMYHFLAPGELCVEGGKYYGNSGIMDVAKFEEQMKWIQDHGYQTLFVSDLLSYLKEGKLPPEKSVVIIFDDGYENNYFLGFPIMKKYNIKVNFAPVLYFSEQKSDVEGYDDSQQPRFTFDELREMQDSGLAEIGSHSYHGHGFFSDRAGNTIGYFFVNKTVNEDTKQTETHDQYVQRLDDDLIEARTVLRERLGVEGDTFFVYPYGRLTKTAEERVEHAGYSCSFVIRDKYVTADSNLFEIPRFNAAQSLTMEDFAAILEGRRGVKN